MKTMFALSIAAFLLAGCAGPNAQLKQTALGATGGALAGAAVTHTPAGAVVGGALGGIGGFLWPTKR